MLRSMIVRADAVLPDDRFKLGGRMYRCTKTQYNVHGERIIEATTLKKKSKRQNVMLIVPKNMPVKIYHR